MNCDNVKPRYYKGGLAITEYIHAGQWDNIRAYVVMQFPYNGEIVEQAFYRSSGANSADSFGLGFTDEQAKGTWIPFNAIVVKVDIVDKETEESSSAPSASMPSKKNFMFILKMPFYDPGKGILSRFHDDLQLAMVSYLMGGGIWETETGKNLFENTKLLPGCIKPPLKSNLVPATMYEVNHYIGTAVSWNWHPIDKKQIPDPVKGRKIDLTDPILWTTIGKRTFISNVLIIGRHLFNYINKHRIATEGIPPPTTISRLHNFPWADDIELFRKNVDGEVGEEVVGEEAAAAAASALAPDVKRARREYGKLKRKSRKNKSKRKSRKSKIKKRSRKRRISKRRRSKRKIRK